MLTRRAATSTGQGVWEWRAGRGETDQGGGQGRRSERELVSETALQRANMAAAAGKQARPSGGRREPPRGNSESHSETAETAHDDRRTR
jgi:hypothetical protein